MNSKYAFSLLIFGLFKQVLSADPTVKITQTYPATTRYNGFRTVIAHKDTDSLMACVASKKPSYRKTQWLFLDFQTNTSVPIATDTNIQNAFKYAIDKPASDSWRLKIRNIQVSDEGVYICRVQLHGFQHEFDRRVLKVVETPRIIDIWTSSHMVVNEGDSAELRCAASGIPTPVISWQLVSGGPLPTGGREYNGPVIQLEVVTRNNDGLYKCIALNRAGTDERKIRLTVRFQPTFKVRSQNLHQALGYSRRLTCEAFGSPLPKHSQMLWFKDGDVLENQNKYTHEAFIGSNSVLMKLTVHTIDESDYGQYRCYAENSEGNGETFVQLKRSETPVREIYQRSRSPYIHANRIAVSLLLVYYQLVVII